MAKKEEIILVGGGGHCKVCIEIIEVEDRFRIAGIVDLREKLHQKVLGYEIIGCDEDLPRLVKEYKYFLVATGPIKGTRQKAEKFGQVKDLGAKFPSVISPLASVSRYAGIGEGSIIMHNASVGAGARIGRNCVINTSAVVEHDAAIGDHCNISTGCIVNGDCHIGERIFIGSNTTIANNLNIASDTIIGAGSVVVKPIDEKGIYVGNPARRLREK